MKLAYIADVHLGNHRRFGGGRVAGINDRGHLTVRALRDAVYLALAQDCGALCVLGDLYDVARPDPQMVACAMSELSKASDAGMMTLVLRGNHDGDSDARGDNALGPLRFLKGTRIVDSDPDLFTFDDAHMLCIPFTSREKPERVIESALRAQTYANNRPMLIGFHYGVRDSNTAPWLADASDSIHVEDLFEIMDKYNVAAAFAGNWHDPRDWTRAGRTIVQVGTLCPTGFSDLGLLGGLAVYDTVTGKVQRYRVASAPLFLKVTGGLGALEAQLTLMGADRCARTFLEWQVSRAEYQDARAARVGLMSRYGVPGVDVIVPDSEVKEQVREAALKARSATTLDKALAQYVPGYAGDRSQQVLGACRAYLAKAGAK